MISAINNTTPEYKFYQRPLNSPTKLGAVPFKGNENSSQTNDYMKNLNNRYKIITQKIEELKRFLPDLQNIKNLPPEVIKENQVINLKRLDSDKPCIGRIKEILPLSDTKEYSKIKTAINNTWIPYQEKHNPNSIILPPIKEAKLAQGMTILTLEADGKIQGIGAIEIKRNKAFIRKLNTAPWNQGVNKKINGVGTALMARLISICFETNNFPISLFAIDNPETVAFYKNIGMQPTRTMHYFTKTFHGFKFDEEEALEFLKKVQKLV